jgi:hypothetical protein
VILSYTSENSQLGFRYEIVRLEKGFSGPAQPNRSPCFQNWLKGKKREERKRACAISTHLLNRGIRNLNSREDLERGFLIALYYIF